MSGEPEGWVLVAHCSAFYINEIVECVRMVEKFADDANIGRKVNC